MEPADKIGFFLFGFTFGIIAGIIITVLNLAKGIDNGVEPDRLPPTKENCIQLFNSLN